MRNRIKDKVKEEYLKPALQICSSFDEENAVNKKISVIAPVYNVEKYLKKCLNSLVNQTLKDIEIICVDDGSVDNTNSVLQEYAKKDSRIKVIVQENQKQGAARNNALKIVQGSYITYVDSDDWLDLNFCEKLLNAINGTDIDFALSEAVRIKKNGKITPYFKFEENKIISGFENIIKVNKIPSYWHVWGKLYKWELLNDIFFE